MPQPAPIGLGNSVVWYEEYERQRKEREAAEDAARKDKTGGLLGKNRGKNSEDVARKESRRKGL